MNTNVIQLFPATRPARTPSCNASELLVINARKLQEQQEVLRKIIDSIRA